MIIRRKFLSALGGGLLGASSLFGQSSLSGGILSGGILGFPNNVIIDTDIASDCDDTSDIAAIFALQPIWTVIGIIVSSLNTSSPMAADAVARFCGTTFPANIGVNQASTPSGSTPNSSAYTVQLASRFVPGQVYADYPEAVSTYRRLLAGCPNNSVTIIMIGFATPMAGLLQSSADGYSSLNGIQLVTAKVKQVCIASGYLPNSAGYDGGTPEFNLASDSVAYSYVAANCPVPIIWGGIEMATYQCGPPSGADPTVSPVKYAYNLYGQPTRPAYSQGAIYGSAGGAYLADYAFGGSNGTMTINSSTGADTWTSTAGESSYLTKVASDATLQAAFNALIAAA